MELIGLPVDLLNFLSSNGDNFVSSSSSKTTKPINCQGNCSHSLIFLFCVAMQISGGFCSGNISGFAPRSPLLFPINNRSLVHYYAHIIIFMLTSVRQLLLINGKSMYYR